MDYDNLQSHIRNKIMILDARTTTQTIHGRPYTASAAVANAIDAIKLHQFLEIDALIGMHGEDLPIGRLSMLVSKHKGSRIFMVRKGAGKVLATIIRVA